MTKAIMHNKIKILILLCFMALAECAFIIFSAGMLHMVTATSFDYYSAHSKGHSENGVCNLDGMPVQCPDDSVIIQQNMDKNTQNIER